MEVSATQLHDLQFLSLVGTGALFALAYLARWRPQTCSHCMHCREEAQRKVADSKARTHDYDHKGGGYRTGDPDRYNCDDEKCSRNRRVD